MGENAVALTGPQNQATTLNMVRIPGGVFRMGSDQHYPEEAPAHLVRVDGFWIDRTAVTNRDFRCFVLPKNPAKHGLRKLRVRRN